MTDRPRISNNFQLPMVNMAHKERTPPPAIEKAPWIAFDPAEPGSDHTVYSFSVPDVGLPLAGLWRTLKNMIITELVEQHGVKRHVINDEWLKKHVFFQIKHNDQKGVNILSFDKGDGTQPTIMAFVEPTLKTDDGKTSAVLRARAMWPNGEYK